MTKAKPLDISKREVWEAFKKVKANRGAAGVDGQTIADFEADLTNNLYKLWNRMSSGSYFPLPVRRVETPKDDGGIRWARRKFKRLRRRPKGAREWLARMRRANPTLFAHWRLWQGKGRTSGAV